jgi:hypothetical protein
VTAPGGSIGSLYVSVHARTGDVEPEIRRALNEAGEGATADLDKIGKKWGEKVSKSTATEIEKHGDDFTHSVERSFAGKIVTIKGVKYRVDRNDALHIFEGIGKGQFAGRLVKDMVEGLEDASRPGGPFEKVGEGIADAIGAGFNVSGKSPLIVALVPAIGALAAVIGAALQGVNALVALLFTLPTIVTGLALAIGSVMIATNGMGKAIQDAFAAKNAKELNAAIKDLAPSAQAFVKELLPLKDVWDTIKKATQEGFFKGFSDTLTLLADTLGPIIKKGLPAIAQAMGTFFRGIGIFLSSPVFQKFLSDVIPATINWLNKFSPALISFLSGLIKAADAAMPFLTAVGDMLNGALMDFSSWLQGMISSGQFSEWLASMQQTMSLLFELGKVILQFFVSFFDTLDEAGGKDLIGHLIINIETLIAFLESPVGENFMAGLIQMIEILLYSFTGLVVIVGAIIAAVEVFIRVIMYGIDWIVNTAWPAIQGFFSDIGFFFEKLWFAAQVFWDKVVKFFTGGVEKTNRKIKESGESIGSFFRELPGKIGGWVISAVTTLASIGYKAGRNLMSNLIQGLKDMLPDLSSIASTVAGTISSWLPGSPAKVGPLSGEGWSYRRGQRMANDLAAGIASQNTELAASIDSSMTTVGMQFSSGAFQFNFNGQQPTKEEAYGIGQSAGKGFVDQVGARNTRLAVRIA